MAENVASLFGGPTGAPEPNDSCIQALEEWLEMARSGQLVGVAMAGLGADRRTQFAVAGLVGGYSMVGAIEMAKAELIEANQDG